MCSPKPDVKAFFEFNGARKSPAANGYRPEHRLEDGSIAIGVHRYEDCECVPPGGTAWGTIAFAAPEKLPRCLRAGMRIPFQEGERIVGHAVITDILNSRLRPGALGRLFAKKSMFDSKYEPLVPPLHKDSAIFTPEERDAYHAWFMENLEPRCEYLRDLVAEDEGVSTDRLDYSFESLLSLWKWFLRRAKVVSHEKPRPHERVKIISRDRIGGKPVEIIDAFDHKFDVKTEMMIRDIGMYVGRTFIKKYPGRVSWAVVTKPKNYLHVNKPLLQGFVRTHSLVNGSLLDKPFCPDFEPIHMVGVQAAKLFDGDAREDDLMKLCHMWAEWIPGGE